MNFPNDPALLHPFLDAKWGTQDVSIPKSTDHPAYLDLFTSWYISGLIIWLGKTLHQIFTLQLFTAQSSAEADMLL
jgi:hypothetical protein